MSTGEGELSIMLHSDFLPQPRQEPLIIHQQHEK